MGLLERLKQLEAEANEADSSVPAMHFEAAVLKVYPKLLAVVEAARRVKHNDNFFVVDGYGHQLLERLYEALASLEEDV